MRGVIGRPWPRKFDAKKRKRIKRLRAEGWKLQAIADKYEASLSSIWKIINNVTYNKQARGK